MVYTDFALFALRLGIGGLMTVHGWPKLKYLKQESARMPGGFIVTILVGLGQFLGGIGMIIGVLPRLAAFSNVIIMLGTIPFMVKWNKPFMTTAKVGGWDYNILLLLGALTITLLGAGNWVLLS